MKSELARVLVASCAMLLCGAAAADEGMWTFNHFPSGKVAQKYGEAPTQAWLDHVRLSSVRIAGGCSASVVSAQGLVMTNHHCARGCIENLSGIARRDYNRDGYFARTQPDEARCPGMEVNQLVDIIDVTPRLEEATRGVPAEGYADARKAVTAAIEKQCASSDDFRCEVISLYRGGRYDLHRYRRFQDVRLVFAPEDAIAFFGGDPDNFNFPRYDLDVTFLRIYGHDGRPMAMADHLAWSDGSIREGDLTYVSGNPGGTSRQKTLAQLDDERDFVLPRNMNYASETRGRLAEYQHRGSEQKRHSTQDLFGFENWLKAMKGQHAALADPAFHAKLSAAERQLRATVAARPDLAAAYGAAWDRIAAIVQRDEELRPEFEALELRPQSELFRIARRLLRHGEEILKPNGERLKEYADAQLPQLRQGVLAERAFHDEYEIARLSWWLTRMREDLGADHPVIKSVFGRRSPAEIARTAVAGSRLKELVTDRQGNATGGLRKALYDGGKAAIDASDDPMIALARALDPAARAIRKRYESEVEGPLNQQEELLARARFAVLGEATYPDATFTLRLSYGAVEGYREKGQRVAPFTTFAGLYARHTGAEPFALPPSWLAAQSRLRLDTPMNFVTSNDIIGGNSGSPVINRRGEVVGLVFDGNIQSLGGDYGFDETVNRTVAVHSAALLEALDKVYGARRLVQEIAGPPAASGR
ncbi:MAG: S46 family peptidase [Pseudomonadota bacterium]|nr:S46 family peptidase [Pseudomonadota bacterium]